LEEAGLNPVALDLAGSGMDHTDTNSIATLVEYSKPLTDYLERLPEGEKVKRISKEKLYPSHTWHFFFPCV